MSRDGAVDGATDWCTRSVVERFRYPGLPVADGWATGIPSIDYPGVREILDVTYSLELEVL